MSNSDQREMALRRYRAREVPVISELNPGPAQLLIATNLYSNPRKRDVGKLLNIASRDTLLSRDFIFDLSASVSRVAISRREFLSLGSYVLYDHMAWGGAISTGEGEIIEIYPGIFDDVHGEDGSAVWISEQRRRGEPRRRPAERLLGRLQIYDAIFRVMGRPVGNDARRQEVTEMRNVLRGLSPVSRARYRHGVRRLRETHCGAKRLYYSAAIRRLRITIAMDAAAWEAAQ